MEGDKGGWKKITVHSCHATMGTASPLQHGIKRKNPRIEATHPCVNAEQLFQDSCGPPIAPIEM